MPPAFPTLTEYLTAAPASSQPPPAPLEPDYQVIAENDDHHTFEFVIAVLAHSLACSNERAFELAMEIHRTGKAVVWTGPRKPAERMRRFIRLHSEIRHRDNVELGPIGCQIEPVTAV